MTSEDKKSQQPLHNQQRDNQAFQQVRDLVLLLCNTISALKIFPSHHSSAIHFRQEFISKFGAFLEKYQKLELEVGEYAFYFQEKAVYQDEISSKSLPFFFYKDGLRLLAFYQGMDDQEINEFLDLVRTESAKPAEESDVVNALWLKDLANVQYYAPEEFIENRILEERVESLTRKGLQIIPQELANRTVEIKVNRENLFSGQLELRPEEKQALESFEPQDIPELPENWQQSFDFVERKEDRQPEPELSEAETVSPGAPGRITLSQQEIETLNGLIERNRQLSNEEEFLNLMMEILAMEKDLDLFKANLDILQDFYRDSIKSGQFGLPVRLNHKIKELKTLISEEQPEKLPSIEAFQAETSSLNILDEIRKLVDQKIELPYSSLFEFLKQFGEPALPFLAELYEKIDHPDFRASIIELIRDKIQKDPGAVAVFVDELKPTLTASVIETMKGLTVKNIISQFSNFLTLSSKELKIQAIEALSSFNDEMANKILMGFMQDSDSEVRLKAANSLKYLGNSSRLKQLMRDISTKQFRKKPLQERKALFEFLGRSRNQEAFNFLKKVYLKKSFLPTATELRICAVAGLEANKTEQAIQLLQRGQRFFNRRVRQAASEALVRLSMNNQKERKNG
ncbi:MAG: HEAT repeat domain-containing protein [Acidobacteriota bacterium]|nr:HEAT repeat domain-containing protein [Acidobacteriota bacterium]MDW3228796.1 HEAT repeat domain-containing protein [Acidobacteriota bacterium]